MASKAMWEVDPETRSKALISEDQKQLAAIQKESNNNVCCDCNAPSPQWASPKFGVFICLSCAGVHRGLGVHISFVRSISMDAFKASEIERMRLGGNSGWRDFFEQHEDTQMRGMSWDDATIAERYSGEVGEEWKERLTCKVEGREYVAGEKRAVEARPTAAVSGRTTTSSPSQSQSPGPRGAVGGGGKVKVDDEYFARLGADNAGRRDDLPPSQGGKYGGFGNMPTQSQTQTGLPGLDEVQKDPMAALTKGFGWFTSTVSKTAKNVNDGYIQPTAKSFAEGDFAKQAQLTAAQIAKQAQLAGKSAQDGFTRFVEGGGSGEQRRHGPLDANRKDFWDDFSSLADQGKRQSSSSIGTSAMGMGKDRSAAAGLQQTKKPDEWDEW
ncbi:hypothetical protein CDD82_6813 [Ophiocordyceps australis]|uniref:Arf-GAP domain-containing protein n=1 Tax=Ophiocordyceps australis TaxID=1399860 RepID=A0A2C5YTA3_9HYPO|nr:hypothetical protein CDD82_6813 [Ophiocordyceps australis]